MSKQPTVLIIDDEVFIRRLIRRMLERTGFNVIEAGSGKQALAVLNDHQSRPDIITCDIAMPDITGFELLQKIKDDPDLAHIPIVMLTAMGQLEEENRAREMGASGYITKPFRADKLKEILNSLVEKID